MTSARINDNNGNNDLRNIVFGILDWWFLVLRSKERGQNDSTFLVDPFDFALRFAGYSGQALSSRKLVQSSSK